VLFLEQPLPDFSDTLSTFVSESATFVLGFEPKNFLGEPGLSFWRSHIQSDDLLQYSAELPLLWRDGHHTFEYRFLHSDGAYRWMNEQYRVIHDTDGHISGAVGVAIDITERKQLEEKLAKAERLAVIGGTAAMVGHDLRNPLQGIASAAYLLRQQCDLLSHDSQGQQRKTEMVNLLELIEGGVMYMNKIVADLQDYAAPIHPDVISVSTQRLLNETFSTMRIPSSVNVVVSVDPGADTLVVDPM
jgi:hypothetical protein